MKRTWVPWALLALLLFVVCCLWILWPAGDQKLLSGAAPQSPKSLQGLPLARMHRQGGVIIARLRIPSEVSGFVCAAGSIHFFESGELKAFYLDESRIVQGVRIPKGTWVQLNPDLTLKRCSFPENTSVQGYVCRGGFGGSEGVSTSFHNSGRLEAFFPPEDIEIQGTPCRATPFGPVYLYGGGGLRECTLARDTVIGGRALREGQSVVLSERGEVQAVSDPSFIERVRGWYKKIFH